MGLLSQKLSADVRGFRSKAEQSKAFEILVEYARKLESCQPDDGKDVQYYVDRFHNSERMEHRNWFADELAKYCELLESAPDAHEEVEVAAGSESGAAT